jgi:5-methylcytosine-specific restriction protein A
MPYAPKRPCRHPACREYATQGGYCAAHQTSRQQSGRVYDATRRQSDPALAEAARIRGSAAWQTLRRFHKAQFPTCCDPFKLHGEYPPLCDQTHHVVPIVKEPERALEWDNLRSLCTGCHRQIEAMERRDEPTAHLFPPPPETDIVVMPFA